MNDDDIPPVATLSVRVSRAVCVLCGKPVVARYRPFCSTRCADLDLGRWLTERYRVPTAESVGETGGGERGGEILPADDDLDH